MADCRWQIV